MVESSASLKFTGSEIHANTLLAQVSAFCALSEAMEKPLSLKTNETDFFSISRCSKKT